MSRGPAFLRLRDWDRPHLGTTPESRFLHRREVLRSMGFLGMAGILAPGVALSAACRQQEAPESVRETIPEPAAPWPVERNEDIPVPERGITPELKAASYNNFYELGTGKQDPWKKGYLLETEPWTLEVAGLCAKPGTFGVDELIRRFGLEERVYRFRCVEAWAMTVPWSGFPLGKLLEAVEPKKEARYVRFLTTHQPRLPGVKRPSRYRWPYYEGLSLAEATNELTLLTLGCYGHALPNQMGAPLRVVVPWKYGYKGAKSVERIELVREQPRTFWNDLQPKEYGFESNVDPSVPHPRWSQASERLLDDGRRVPTRYLNGYAKEVGHLYG